jgi:triosephosphate isomerase (TIM)
LIFPARNPVKHHYAYPEAIMRTTIIAGNWKMYKDLAETAALIDGLRAAVAKERPRAVVVICPPFTSLPTASSLLAGTGIALGAQNMSQHDEGAYTGEVSWKMLRSTGCTYVILGHSERRQYFAETDALINAKSKVALAHELSPIICVGETLEQREKNLTASVIETQIRGVLAGIPASDMNRVVIAYEPVWAIGTGKTASPQQAEEVHRDIRRLVASLYDAAVAEKLVIQYGGSVKPENAKELLSQPDIDGALVGGACLKADSFASIIAGAK